MLLRVGLWVESGVVGWWVVRRVGRRCEVGGGVISAIGQLSPSPIADSTILNPDKSRSLPCERC